VCVEPHDAFVHYATAKFWFFNLRDLVTVLRADGKQLPLREASVDGAYCIGAPSIVGAEPLFGELARVVRPGGHVIVSDIVWREKPGVLSDDWQWVAELSQITADEYGDVMERAGLDVTRLHLHGRDAWEDYWRPMLEVAQEAKTAQPADVFFADEIEGNVELERRAVDGWLDYATFVARRP
jgi:SAM-dependent methyltransferase